MIQLVFVFTGQKEKKRKEKKRKEKKRKEKKRKEKERKGKERKGKERKGKERKGKERKEKKRKEKKRKTTGAREKAQRLRALVAFPEDTRLIPSTHMQLTTILTPVPGDPDSSDHESSLAM